MYKRQLQRIGLSATIRPLSLAAAYLAPGEPVSVVAPPMKKRADMQVNSVLPDMRVMAEGSIWPDLCRAVYDQCRGMRTVIAFREGRAPAEKLAHGVNELAGEGFARTHHGSVSREQRQEMCIRDRPRRDIQRPPPGGQLLQPFYGHLRLSSLQVAFGHQQLSLIHIGPDPRIGRAGFRRSPAG